VNVDGLGNELERLRERLGPKLCGDRPCAHTVFTERVLRTDGTVERRGEPPPPLCAACPERENPRRRIRHVEVVLNAYGDSARTSEALAKLGEAEREQQSTRTEPAELEQQQTDNGVPAYFRERQRREDERWERDRELHRRSKGREGMLIGPEDFGDYEA
jgi:hypothetical protein